MNKEILVYGEKTCEIYHSATYIIYCKRIWFERAGTSFFKPLEWPFNFRHNAFSSSIILTTALKNQKQKLPERKDKPLTSNDTSSAQY